MDNLNNPIGKYKFNLWERLSLSLTHASSDDDLKIAIWKWDLYSLAERL
jgi:hypothetical protein